jgi:hypothetical protein
MKILIGGLDYSTGLDAVAPLVVERKLNAPSTCRLFVTLGMNSTLPVPLRNQAISVAGDDGTTYFTGYLAVSPFAEYVGLGMAGPVYRWALEGVSDEILLDTQLLPPSAGTTGASAGALMTALVTRTGLTSGPASLNTSALTLTTDVSHFVPETGAKWSEAAGQVASAARAAYRAVRGALQLVQVGATVHTLGEGNGGNGLLDLAGLTLTSGGERALANDVTVCGAEEPVAYVTEYFRGDGATLVFPLSEIPYFGPAASAKIIHELFNEASIDSRRWGYSGRDEYFSITSAGLTMNGGTGRDGEAAVVWLDAVEAGGTLLLEASGVNLSLGSTGTMAAVFAGVVNTANCVAGFAVTSAAGTGVVSVAPLIEGVVAGASYPLDATQQYTLRARLYCPEVERIAQVYRVVGETGLVAYGGGGIVATGRVLLEIEGFVDGVGSTPVVLYDGAVGFLPGSYTVAAASSLNLIGTMRSLFLTSLGTGWVTSVVPGGGPRTRPVGTVAEASECTLSRVGALTFYAGYAPVVGETVEVRYRTAGRAVGRAVNAASQAALAAAGMPETAVWMGTATHPAARTSLDCRNAALALVTAATSVSAAWSGSYKSSNLGIGSDVWPGDALLLNSVSQGLDVQVAVRSVRLEYSASVPDVVRYAIGFSNDWANDLSIKTSKMVPADACLPAVAGATYLANLSGLVVTEISATAVTVAAGVTPPSGGGFEVRRRDFAFQAGQDADLVMRSGVGTFDIPRSAEAERFFVRVYDGSTPPNYSEFSVGLFVNLPLVAASV